MTVPEQIARMEQKLGSFMEAQEKTNERLSESIGKISDAMAKSQAQQVEINQLSSMVQKLDSKHDAFGVRLGAIESNQAVTKQFRTQITWLVRACITALIGGVAGLVFWAVRTVVAG